MIQIKDRVVGGGKGRRGFGLGFGFGFYRLYIVHSVEICQGLIGEDIRLVRGWSILFLLSSGPRQDIDPNRRFYFYYSFYRWLTYFKSDSCYRIYSFISQTLFWFDALFILFRSQDLSRIRFMFFCFFNRPYENMSILNSSSTQNYWLNGILGPFKRIINI